MTKSSFYLPERLAPKKPKYNELFRWNDANVYAAFRQYALSGQCGLIGCTDDDHVVYAFPASRDLNPPPYHWRCFQKEMDIPTARMFKHLTSDAYSHSNKRKKRIAKAIGGEP